MNCSLAVVSWTQIGGDPFLRSGLYQDRRKYLFVALSIWSEFSQLTSFCPFLWTLQSNGQESHWLLAKTHQRKWMETCLSHCVSIQIRIMGYIHLRFSPKLTPWKQSRGRKVMLRIILLSIFYILAKTNPNIIWSPVEYHCQTSMHWYKYLYRPLLSGLQNMHVLCSLPLECFHPD